MMKENVTIITKNGLATGIMLVIIALFFCYLWMNALNVPLEDDIGLLISTNEFVDHPREFITILLNQHNDHRIFFSRLSGVLVYLVQGELNFRSVILLGMIPLLILAFSFYMVYRKYRNGLTAFLPIVFLTFSLNVIAAHMWALVAYQSTLSLAFSFIGLYFIQKDKQNRWLWSIPFLISATLADLDGLTMVVIIPIWLLIQKRYQHLIVFVAFAAAFIALYFYDFRFSSTTNTKYSLEKVVLMLKGFVIFVGSFARIVSDTHGLIISMALGTVILTATTALIGYQMHYRTADTGKSRFSLQKLEFLDFCFLRTLAAAAMIAIGRAVDGVENMMAIRFQVFSLCIILMFYLLLVRRFWKVGSSSAIFKAILVGSALAGAFSYIKYDVAVQRLNSLLKSDAFNYAYNHKLLHQNLNLKELDPDFFRNYHFPDYFGQNVLNVWKQQVHDDENIRMEMKIGNPEDFSPRHLQPDILVRISGVPIAVPDKNVYLLISNMADASSYLSGLNQESSTWSKMVSDKSQRILVTSFASKLPKGKHQFRLCWLEDNQAKGVLITPEADILNNL